MKKTATQIASLAEQAQSEFNAEHYKEAIVLYKQLWQQSDDVKWQQHIAQCYQQRAFSFSARGMIKEALVLWDNYIAFNQQPVTAYDQYISWLLLTNHQTKIQTTLKQLTAEQLDKQYPRLATLLGALIITQQPELRDCLPIDSRLVKDIDCVRSALKAYQQGDLQQTKDCLKRLPYRSSFRDFRNLLSACILPAEEVKTFHTLLTKIPTQSPYARVAKMLVTARRCQGKALLDALPQFSDQQGKLMAQLKGFDEKRLKLIHLLTDKVTFTKKDQFNLVIQHKSLFEPKSAQLFCQLILLDYPAGKWIYKKHFGPVQDFEKNRLTALKEEQNNDFYAASLYWRQCINQLIEEKTDNQLKIALILRHLAEGMALEEKIDLLTESLDYDPNDLNSYLTIIKSHQALNNEEEYNQWLEKAEDLFPQEIDLLTLSIHAARAKKAHKKAASLAQKILTLDPINSFAKQILFSSHLAHARYLIGNKTFHLVEKEIQQAIALKVNKVKIFQAKLVQGLWVFAAEDKERGLQMVSDSLVKLYPEPVNQHFWVVIEALSTQQPVLILLKKLPSISQQLITESALNTLVEQINQVLKEDENIATIDKALNEITPILERSFSQQDYSEESLLSLAHLLFELDQFDLLSHCSKQAFKYQSVEPVWFFYRTYAQVRGIPNQCTSMQISQLHYQLTQARNKQELHIATLIETFIDGYLQEKQPVSFDFLFNRHKNLK